MDRKANKQISILHQVLLLNLYSLVLVNSQLYSGIYITDQFCPRVLIKSVNFTEVLTQTD